MPRTTGKLDPAIVQSHNDSASPATPVPANASTPSSPAHPAAPGKSPEPVEIIRPPAITPAPVILEGAAGWVAIPTTPNAVELSPEEEKPSGGFKYFGIAAVVLIILGGLFFLWRGISQPTSAATPPVAVVLTSPAPTTAVPQVGGATLTAAALLAAPPSVTPESTLPPTLTPVTPASTPAPSGTPSDAPALTASPGPSTLVTPMISALESSEHELAFISNRDGDFQLYVLDPSQPAEWHTVSPPADYEVVAWPSFCGKRLAFEAEDRSLNLPRWIFLFDPQTGVSEPLKVNAKSPDRAYSPGCSPSGRYMTATVMRNGRWHLDVIDLEQGAILSEQPAGGYPQFGFASWPDKEDRFVWLGIKNSGYYDVNQTSMFNPGPARTVQLTQGRYPAISPDGTKLAYFCGNLSNLCMAELPSVKLLFQIPISYFKLINGKTVAATVTWSADGEWVYFSSSINGNWDIYRMHPDGSQVQNLTEGSTADEIMPAAR